MVDKAAYQPIKAVLMAHGTTQLSKHAPLATMAVLNVIKQQGSVY
jgi:hypothetical protein